MLDFYLLYRNPRDFPEGYVARIQRVRAGTVEADREPFARGFTLDGVRSELPRHLANIDRQPNDEPQIVEVWL